jgi:hypothetical protein
MTLRLTFEAALVYEGVNGYETSTEQVTCYDLSWT